jgi:2-(3-amino-3-carboxypropyl)histidine synthase
MTSELTFGFDEIDEDMRRLKPKNVLLQLPSGLKRKAEEIAQSIEQRYGCEVLISGDTCFGACDIQPGSAVLVDLTIQVGHSAMPSVECGKPVLFVTAKIALDLKRLIGTAVPLLTSPVGLLAVSPHLDQLDEAKELLEAAGLEVVIGTGDSRLDSPGQVLGCDYSSARSISDSVSSFLLLGGGSFHAIGLKLSTGKPVITIDPERAYAAAEEAELESFKRKRHAVIALVSTAKSIGIIVSSKSGQGRPALADNLVRAVREAGRSAHIVIMDNINPDALQELGFDAYVSTACPRIALDDSEQYSRPVCTPNELLIALKKSDWVDYGIDEWGIDHLGGG